jgi:hypothetical protein
VRGPGARECPPADTVANSSWHRLQVHMNKCIDEDYHQQEDPILLLYVPLPA